MATVISAVTDKHGGCWATCFRHNRNSSAESILRAGVGQEGQTAGSKIKFNVRRVKKPNGMLLGTQNDGMTIAMWRTVQIGMAKPIRS